MPNLMKLARQGIVKCKGCGKDQIGHVRVVQYARGSTQRGGGGV